MTKKGHHKFVGTKTENFCEKRSHWRNFCAIWTFFL